MGHLSNWARFRVIKYKFSGNIVVNTGNSLARRHRRVVVVNATPATLWEGGSPGVLYA